MNISRINIRDSSNAARYLLGVALVGLSGCVIKQAVKPVERLQGKQVCIIKNAYVRQTFEDTYSRAISDRGYVVKVVKPQSIPADCIITSTYVASWAWDGKPYMSFAELLVFSRGTLIGSATYDSSRGVASLDKYVDVDKKVAELVNELFAVNR